MGIIKSHAFYLVLPGIILLLINYVNGASPGLAKYSIAFYSSKIALKLS